MAAPRQRVCPPPAPVARAWVRKPVPPPAVLAACSSPDPVAVTLPKAPTHDIGCFDALYQSAAVVLRCDGHEEIISIIVPAGRFESRISQADADAQALEYAEANQVCPWWNVEQVVACPLGTVGPSVTVPAHRFPSYVSQADADSRALEYAQANLACEEQVWWNTEQIVTCPENRVGDPVVVPAHSFSSTQSQNDANALAVAHGETLLVCAQTETQYYEIPFRQELTLGWYFDDDSHQGAITIYFYGRVRLWASGTVEMLGGIRCNRAGQSYRVWVGPTTTNGRYYVVGTTTLTNTFEDVYWVHRLEEGSYVHCVLGADFGTDAVWLRKLWSFADSGWAFPVVFDNFGTAYANMDGTITRSEAAITCTGTAYNYSASAAWDWWSSVTPGIAAGDWAFSGYSGVVQVSTPEYTTTAALPDSASTGILARWYSGSPYPGAADVTRICSVGPFYRPAHDPTPQMGIDPMGQ